jgi:hypothetical protein
LCAGKTPPLKTNWQMYGITALYIDIDTTP